MRILFIGGTRFIGYQAVLRLHAQGHTLAVFHRGRSEPELPSGVQHLHGERADLVDFRADFQQFAPEVVVDMMALNQGDGETLARVFRGLARRLVVISSCDVYRAYDRLRGADPGPPDPNPLTEDSPLRDKLYPYREQADSPEHRFYEYDKILVERAVMGRPELPATVLRLPMVYGPGDYQHRTFEYLKRMDDDRPYILLAADLAGWRGLRGYVEDMGAAIALCATQERAAWQTYHVADRESLTERAWVSRIAQAAGWQGDIVALPNVQLPAHLQHGYDTSQDWALDSSRIREALGYADFTSPEVAMQRTVAWERANPPEQIDPANFDYAAEDTALEAARGAKT